MSILANIQIRRVSNGYIVGTRCAENALGYPILGDDETFFATLAEIAAAAPALVEQAIADGEAAIEEFQRRQQEYASLDGGSLCAAKQRVDF